MIVALHFFGAEAAHVLAGQLALLIVRSCALVAKGILSVLPVRSAFLDIALRIALTLSLIPLTRRFPSESLFRISLFTGSFLCLFHDIRLVDLGTRLLRLASE